MARDIEEFLKRAAERRQQQKAGGATPPAQAPPPQRPQQPPLQQQSPQQRERYQEPEIVQDVEVVSKKQPKQGKQRESVSEHVQRHLDTSQMTEKAKSLGSSVAQVGKSFDQKVHEHLDHDICSVDNLRVSEVGKTAIPSGPSMVSRVREMLSKPETAGQAILIAEILKRPDFDDE